MSDEADKVKPCPCLVAMMRDDRAGCLGRCNLHQLFGRVSEDGTLAVQATPFPSPLEADMVLRDDRPRRTPAPRPRIGNRFV